MTMRTRVAGLSLRVKQQIVRTKLEPVLRNAQLAGEWLKGRRDPAFAKLHREKAAMGKALALLVSDGSNCVDIGGHIGSVLSDLCKLAPNGRHIVVEADPAKAESLIRRFPEVNVVAKALMSKPGIVRFEVDLERGGYSHVVSDGLEGSGSSIATSRKVIEVEAIKLDDLIGEDRVDFVKIDVEGAELVVLQGATALLAKQRPRIVFEAGYVPGDPWESDLPALYEFFDGAGYVVYLLVDFVDDVGPTDLAGFVSAHEWPFQAWNYVALPKEDSLVVPGRAVGS